MNNIDGKFFILTISIFNLAICEDWEYYDELTIENLTVNYDVCDDMRQSNNCPCDELPGICSYGCCCDVDCTEKQQHCYLYRSNSNNLENLICSKHNYKNTCYKDKNERDDEIDEKEEERLEQENNVRNKIQERTRLLNNPKSVLYPILCLDKINLKINETCQIDVSFKLSEDSIPIVEKSIKKRIDETKAFHNNDKLLMTIKNIEEISSNLHSYSPPYKTGCPIKLCSGLKNIGYWKIPKTCSTPLELKNILFREHFELTCSLDGNYPSELTSENFYIRPINSLPSIKDVRILGDGRLFCNDKKQVSSSPQIKESWVKRINVREKDTAEEKSKYILFGKGNNELAAPNSIRNSQLIRYCKFLFLYDKRLTDDCFHINNTMCQDHLNYIRMICPYYQYENDDDSDLRNYDGRYEKKQKKKLTEPNKCPESNCQIVDVTYKIKYGGQNIIAIDIIFGYKTQLSSNDLLTIEVLWEPYPSPYEQMIKNKPKEIPISVVNDLFDKKKRKMSRYFLISGRKIGSRYEALNSVSLPIGYLPSRNCANMYRTPLVYEEYSHSQCILNIPKKEFKKCDHLRKLIFATMRKRFLNRATHISIHPILSHESTANYWIPIRMYENKTKMKFDQFLYGDETPNETIARYKPLKYARVISLTDLHPICNNVPYLIRLRIFTRFITDFQYKHKELVVGSYVEWKTKDLYIDMNQASDQTYEDDPDGIISIQLIFEVVYTQLGDRLKITYVNRYHSFYQIFDLVRQYNNYRDLIIILFSFFIILVITIISYDKGHKFAH
ncbi:hypothetical protein SNEBB_010924 [Seison nebaliae]|nr:hypothetical protein SNEBB_010924 [Seison nebaliae]